MAIGRIVVVGASAGGVRAYQALASTLTARFPAPILAVQHVGSHPSILPDLITRSGPLGATHAVDGERLEVGRIHVAPPDRHMLVEGDHIRVLNGPKENHSRPAIDPLFRSAALAKGPAVIGVLLTGLLDDGTAGLQTIKQHGGVAIVQDPKDAESAGMPGSALRHVQVDHCVSLAAIGPLIEALAAKPPKDARVSLLETVARENEIMLGKGDFLSHLEAIGRPSTFVCPDCSGSLWEVSGTDPPRFRCHTGHGYTLRNLQYAQSTTTDEAMWSALRALQEKEMMLEALAERDASDEIESGRLKAEAADVARHAETLRGLIERG